MKQLSMLPEITEDPDKATGSPLGSHAVRAYNNDVTPFDRVVGVFIVSCGYSEEVSKRYTRSIHVAGSLVCFWANKERCEEVARDFEKIGVKAEVIEESN